MRYLRRNLLRTFLVLKIRILREVLPWALIVNLSTRSRTSLRFIVKLRFRLRLLLFVLVLRIRSRLSTTLGVRLPGSHFLVLRPFPRLRALIIGIGILRQELRGEILGHTRRLLQQE